MSKGQILDSKNSLVFYKKRVFSIKDPAKYYDMASEGKLKQEKMKIASEMGLSFYGECFSCSDCSHTGLFAFVMQAGQAVFSNNPSSFCCHDPEEWTVQFVVGATTKKDKSVFGVRRNPCVVDIGMWTAIVEAGLLDEFEIFDVNIDPMVFIHENKIKSVSAEEIDKVIEEQVVIYQDVIGKEEKVTADESVSDEPKRFKWFRQPLDSFKKLFEDKTLKTEKEFVEEIKK